tara:strand:- start:2159 stop:2722 length:564 start_codon:yes stop_codon:yes gene_type:complete
MELRSIMEEYGAILKGHFILTSGRHSNIYLEKFRLLENPEMVDKIGEEIAKVIKRIEIDVVFGAAIGGILISYGAAKALKTRNVFAERVDGELKLRRGFKLNQGEKVLIVEDIITTGGSVEELLEIVKYYHAEVASVVCIADRTENGIDFGPNTKSLMRFPAITWKPENCPLCKKNEPLTSRGRTGK